MTTVELQGTLREDGTLVLDERPNLPAGRVKVVVQPLTDANDVIAVLNRIHAAQAARGHVPRSAEEINAYLEEMRDDGERTAMIERIQEEGRRQRDRRSGEGE